MADKRPVSPRRQSILFPLLAIGILIAVLVGAVVRQLAQPSGPEQSTPVAAQTRPPASPTADIHVDAPTASLGLLPTHTPTRAPASPIASPTPAPQPTQAIQPTPAPLPTLATPDWDQVYGALGASARGTGLLVLHTNDSWGYLDPCG